MKQVKAYVRKIMVDQVIRALEEIGSPTINAIDVRMLGGKLEDKECCVSVEYGTTYCEMAKLELICVAKETKKVVEVIKKNAYTGKEGDGIIAISPVEEVVKIQTGEKEE